MSLLKLLQQKRKTTSFESSKRNEDRIKEEKEEEKPLADQNSGTILKAIQEQERTQANEPEDDYVETDLELDDDNSDKGVVGRTAYLNACRMLGVVPASYFLRHMTDEQLSLAHHGLGAQGMKALTYPLMNNTYIQQLDLSDNWLEGEGGECAAFMLRENCYITELDLSNNKLGSRGCAAICKVLQTNVTLQSLNLAGNDLDDDDVPYIAEAFLETSRLKDINLSHNRFGSTSSQMLADAISENETIEKIDLSWNNFRLKSAVNICEGIATNSRLRKVNLAMNGLGNEGAFGVGDILKLSGTITHIDVSNNRIGSTGALVIGKALEANHDLLRQLKFGHNPAGVEGVKAILKGVCVEGSVVTLIDFSGIEIDKEIRTVKEELQASRNIIIEHGPVLSDYIIVGKKKVAFLALLETGSEDTILPALKEFCDGNKVYLNDALESSADYTVTLPELARLINDSGVDANPAMLEQLDQLLNNYKLPNGHIDFSSIKC